jgi:hypothetical protein
MALAVTEELLQLADAIRGWAQRNCPPEVVRAAAARGPGAAGRGPGAAAGVTLRPAGKV